MGANSEIEGYSLWLWMRFSSLRQIMCVFAFLYGYDEFIRRFRIALRPSLDNAREEGRFGERCGSKPGPDGRQEQGCRNGGARRVPFHAFVPRFTGRAKDRRDVRRQYRKESRSGDSILAGEARMGRFKSVGLIFRFDIDQNITDRENPPGQKGALA